VQLNGSSVVVLVLMIRGCAALKDVGSLVRFLIWSAVYWSVNGLGVWAQLARNCNGSLTIPRRK
jgi:hypothetical protein